MQDDIFIIYFHISHSVTRRHIRVIFPLILFVSCVQYTRETQEKHHHSNKKAIIESLSPPNLIVLIQCTTQSCHTYRHR